MRATGASGASSFLTQAYKSVPLWVTCAGTPRRVAVVYLIEEILTVPASANHTQTQGAFVAIVDRPLQPETQYRQHRRPCPAAEVEHRAIVWAVAMENLQKLSNVSFLDPHN